MNIINLEEILDKELCEYNTIDKFDKRDILNKTIVFLSYQDRLDNGSSSVEDLFKAKFLKQELLELLQSIPD